MLEQLCESVKPVPESLRKNIFSYMRGNEEEGWGGRDTTEFLHYHVPYTVTFGMALCKLAEVQIFSALSNNN